MKKVLILAYYYPPTGGGGVQRTVKFVKYLRDYGFSPTVVGGTGLSNGSERMPKDRSLCAEVGHAKTFEVELSRFDMLTRKLTENKVAKKIPPLAFRWWVSAAMKTSEKAIQLERPDVIYVTVSPFQTAHVAADLAARYGIPWVLDMRDPWALDPITTHASWFHYRLDLRAMKNACLTADAVIMNTPRSLERLQKEFPQLRPDKLFCITNGWDGDDMEKTLRVCQDKKTPTKLIIAHTGSFLTALAIKVDPSSRKELGLGDKKVMDRIRYRPGKSHLLARTPYYLLKAIRLLLDEGKISKKDIGLVFCGGGTPADRHLVDRFGLNAIVEFKSYVNHVETLRVLDMADALFLPLHLPHNGQCPLIVPGKTYEYMAARKPILALVPTGDARDFVLRSSFGFICHPTNVQQISQVVLSLLQRRRSRQQLRMKPQDHFLKQFDRRHLTKRLAEVLDFAISVSQGLRQIIRP